MTTFDLPKEYNDPSMSIDVANSKLPIPAPKLIWRNGEFALKDIAEVGGVRKFGGWSLSAKDYEELKEELPTLPETWKLTKLSGKDEQYEMYLTRDVWFAPIRRRFAWFVSEQGDKNYSITQYVGYLAVGSGNNTLTPWGAVVLQAKSLMGKELDARIAEYKALTAPIRGTTLPTYFYHPLGTFGKEPVFAKAKSKDGNSSSPVTNVQLYRPAQKDVEAFTKMCFVGQETAKIILDIGKATEEWAKAWNEKKAQPTAVVVENHVEEENPFGPPSDSDFSF